MAIETVKDQVSMDVLRKDLEALRADMAKLGADVRTLAGARVDEGLAAARDLSRQAAERAEAAADAARQQVSEHPGVALATAFGVGVALGLLFARRG